MNACPTTKLFSRTTLAMTLALAPLALTAGCVAGGERAGEDEVAASEEALYVLKPALWSSSVIPVCWETSGNDTEKGWVRDAVEKTWEQETAITFTGWGTCNASTHSGIRIATANAWPSTAGLGNQLDNLANGMLLNFVYTFVDGAGNQPFGSCAGAARESCTRAIAVHEFGHALGFAHEQNRGDTPSTCTQAPQGGNGDTAYGSWDLTSVMNYCNPAWNGNGQLSPTDIAGASQYYGSPRSISAASWGSGRIDAFYRGADMALWHTASVSGSWTTPDSLGGVLSSAPAAVSWGPNRLDIFFRGSDGALWHKFWDGASWSGFESLGGQIVGAPAAVSWGSGRLDVFVRGTDGALYHNAFQSGWSGFHSLGGTVTGTPSAVSWGANRLDVFARRADGALGHHFWNGAAWGSESLGGVISGSPSAVSWGANRIDVFARGSDHAEWRNAWNGSSWSGFNSIGGWLYGSPSAVSWGANRIDIFERNFNQDLAHSATSDGFSSVQTFGATFGGTPTGISWGANRLDVLLRGMDNRLWQTAWNGSTWTGLQPIGPVLVAGAVK